MTTIPPEKILFGQFLIENKIITLHMLKRALEIQAGENSETLKESHRLLGQILFENFHVFKNRLELNTYLNKYKQFKEQVEQIRFDAKNYGCQ